MGTLLFSAAAIGGGGPENVLLVVNTNSLSSKTVANHWIKMRNIPSSNVVYVDWRGGLDSCHAQYFWSGILSPALDTIKKRQLSAQIDYIVYSTDIPWRMDLTQMFPDQAFPDQLRPFASTTSATFLYRYLEEKNPALVLPVVNSYVPGGGETGNDVVCKQLGDVDSRGFRSSYIWDRTGKRVDDPSKGQSFMLSTMLGVTAGRGNTMDEVLSYLKRSAAADGTRPLGTFYYMKNDDIRSKTRHDCFEEAAKKLLWQGVQARVLKGTIPQEKNDVLGIMAGTSDFDFAASKSKLRPGAICEHLTSLGGILFVRTGQTPLTEFLKFGAAGASGTVIEPMAMQCKFPMPTLFLHYARGCSLAESFYQSVTGPYQLLIVGDPLCQPWATIPTVTLPDLRPGQEVKGELTLRPTASTGLSHKIGTMELYVDGRMVARFPPEQPLKIDTAKLIDGYHELRIVAVDADPIESRGRIVVPIMVNNHGSTIELKVTPDAKVSSTDKVTIAASQPGATAVVVRQNRREIARFKGESGELEVFAATFGRGPVVLQAESEGEHPAISQPLVMEVD